MTNNKTTTEIEEDKFIKKLKREGYWNKNEGWENGFVEEAIRKGFKEGQKQNVDDVLKLIDSREFLERLADLEHEQWIVWVSYMLNNLTGKNKERWYAQCETPYPELSDEEQESDRHFAKIVLEELKAQIKNGGNDGKED
jgi:hypothetical protein